LADNVCLMNEVDDWLGLIKEDMLPSGLKIQSVKPSLTKRPCAILIDLTVHPDGNIHLCSCRNILMDPDLQIGNVTDMPLGQAFREMHLILDRWERGYFPRICERCSMYCDPAVSLAGNLRSTIKAKLLNRKI